MKNYKLALITGVFVCAFAPRSYAQVTLPEVKILAASYKYLNAVNYSEAPQPVRLLQQKVAEFDVRNAEYYDDDYEGYYIAFFIPDGRILAAYDRDGKLLRTAEKFKNVKLPAAVREAVGKCYPQWAISKDVYLVSYYDQNNRGQKSADKKYKLLLERGNKRVRIEADEYGGLFSRSGNGGVLVQLPVCY